MLLNVYIDENSNEEVVLCVIMINIEWIDLKCKFIRNKIRILLISKYQRKRQFISVNMIRFN